MVGSGGKGMEKCHRKKNLLNPDLLSQRHRLTRFGKAAGQ